MNESPELQLLARIQKQSRFVTREMISTQEFINAVFGELADTEQVYLDLLPAMWAAIPLSIQNAFAAAVHDAARPDFHHHTLRFYLGPPARSDDELWREANLRTANVKSWAAAFVEFLTR